MSIPVEAPTESLPSGTAPTPAGSSSRNVIRRGGQLEYARPRRTLKYYSSRGDYGMPRYVSAAEHAAQEHARAAMARRMPSAPGDGESRVASRQPTSRTLDRSTAPRTAARSDSGVERMSYESPQSSSMTGKLQRQHELIFRREIRGADAPSAEAHQTDDSEAYFRFLDRQYE